MKTKTIIVAILFIALILHQGYLKKKYDREVAEANRELRRLKTQLLVLEAHMAVLKARINNINWADTLLRLLAKQNGRKR